MTAQNSRPNSSVTGRFAVAVLMVLAAIAFAVAPSTSVGFGAPFWEQILIETAGGILAGSALLVALVNVVLAGHTLHARRTAAVSATQSVEFVATRLAR